MIRDLVRSAVPKIISVVLIVLNTIRIAPTVIKFSSNREPLSARLVRRRELKEYIWSIDPHLCIDGSEFSQSPSQTENPSSSQSVQPLADLVSESKTSPIIVRNIRHKINFILYSSLLVWTNSSVPQRLPLSL